MRLVLAGTGSAVGKTTIATGIMKALSSDYEVQPFKVGPDYIDPTYHTLATKNSSRNLDSFFMTDAQIRESFERGMKVSKSDMGIIEGVRGLYEGISPTGDVGNTASVAKALNAPVVLILNARSLVKSAAAIVIGFKTLDPQIRIEGVILNQVKNRKHFLKAKEAVEKLTKTTVIGGVPRSDDIRVEQRHLGLVPAVERESLLGFIDHWGQVMEENLDLDILKSIMKGAGDLPLGREDIWKEGSKKRIKIGVARDEVFTFYYQENLESLEANHADIIYFSPLHDEEIPDVDGIYLGGGYPEIFSRELEANHSMRKSVARFHQENRPIYAECGGLMYLTRSINQHEMCGVFPYHSQMTKKPQALSYTIAEAIEDNIILKKGETYRGHEFHYSKVNVEGKRPKFAFAVQRGSGIHSNKDGLMSKNVLASYVHTHVAACPPFPANFTDSARE
ncbi:MAG TPA: Ni-sirohydrochlorin a,c-diamide synthase [Methanobacteriaceae archaeon]|nr:Ni-sirohydrochlorin a,c-diamide synthase [Methanobacteriaceae archaeon]